MSPIRFILGNAFRTILRNKGRNLLIIVIVAVISLSCTIGLCIRSTAKTTRDEGLANTQVTATISVDRSQLIGQARMEFDEANPPGSTGANPPGGTDTNPPGADGQDQGTDVFDSLRQALELDSLSLSDYQYYAQSTSVETGYYYYYSSGLNATDDFQAVSTSSSTGGSFGAGGAPQAMGIQGGVSSSDFSLYGFSSDNAVANAPNGSFTTSSGEVFSYTQSSLGDVIITQELANFNGLTVGDSFSLTDPDDSETTYSFIVVGIYENTVSATTGFGASNTDSANAIYTSTLTLDEYGLSSDSGLNFTYVFASANDYMVFSEEVYELGLDDTYLVQSADVEQYESSLVPLNNLASFALTFLLVVLGVGGLVMIVINLFNIRERKYEVGVLTAIGVRKAKVGMQFVSEILMVTLMGLVVGAAVGSVVSVPVASKLLESQIASQESETTSQLSQFGRDTDFAAGAPGAGGVPDDNGPNNSAGGTGTDTDVTVPDQVGTGGFSQAAVTYLSDINATVNLGILAQLLAIGIVLSLISSLAGVIFVMRYEPLQILADRS